MAASPSPSFRPVLRSIETIVVPDARYGQLLVLRDTQGITDAHAEIPPPLVPIVARFTGARTCEEIAADVSAELKSEVPVEVVVRLAKQLDDGLFLESATFRRARHRVEGEFASASVRPASHAGGAYHADPHSLERYLDAQCLAHAKPAHAKRNGGRGAKRGAIVGLIAPHIDPWRGAVGYGHAYAALARSLAPEVDTFVLFGTSHAPMREPFALCNKSFATPLGTVEADDAAIEAIAKRVPFDAYADQFNHKREHSLEFQVVFLRHVLKGRPFRIIPVLAGLGEHQARRSDPGTDDASNAFLDAVRGVIESRPGRVVVVAGADLAHMGPRFGDDAPLREKERMTLEETDRESLACATDEGAPAFWEDVVSDLETRRVCGLAPIYSLLRMLPKKTAGEVLHYEQTIDEDGSIVSHAGVGFFG